MKITIIIACIISMVIFFGWISSMQFGREMPVSLRPNELNIIKNMENIRSLPPNFRMMTSAYKRHLGYIPTRKGLNQLHASGSSQFSKRGLKAIIKMIPFKKIILIDLRQESHGFLDGTAVSWYGYRNWNNQGKSAEDIALEEIAHLKEVENNGSTLIFNDKQAYQATPLHVKESLSESQLAASENIPYVRFYVTDHKRPDDLSVDTIINFFKTVPDDTWLHFHCAGGKGRTTTFLIMYDIYKNAQDVSLDEIIRRQWFLGGADLASNNPNSQWKHGYANERIQFLKNFYEFSRANPTYDISWSEWVSKIGLEPKLKS